MQKDTIYSIEKIQEAAYGFGRQSEVSAMLRQLLEDRTLNHKDLDKTIEIEKLKLLLLNLIDIINAHEIETLDCDRSGDKYCDCLQKQIILTKKLLGIK